MSKISQLHNEIENFNTDVRRLAARDLLNAEARRLDNSLIPLKASHKEMVQKEKEDRAVLLLGAAAVAAGLCALTAWCIHKGKSAIEAKAQEEKARLDEEKKEIYRKLSSLKGRI